MNTRRIALAAVMALTVGALAGCQKAGPDQPAFKGVDLTGAEYARTLNLSDQDGRARSLADFKGKVLVVFFGYTQCPDVCPTTMAELAQLKRSLGADGERLQAVFVTVDPERDQAGALKQYVAGFDPAFVALRGTPEQTLATAKSFKVFYSKVPARDGTGYTVDHTAGAYVFDPRGRLRVESSAGS